MAMKKLDVFPLLGNLGHYTPTAKTFFVTHLDGPSLFKSSEEDILLILLANDAFGKKTATYLSAPFDFYL